MVWRDLNGDGEATADEMLTLAQAGIARFNLGFTQTDLDVNGNFIARTGTYVRTDASTRAMASVQFALDETGDVPVIPENANIDDLVALPNLPGLSAIPDLRTAMFFDATLKAMVEDLVFGDHDFDTFAESALDNVRLHALTAPGPSDYGDDILHGGAGADQLFGVGGDDLLYGGDGNDLIVGGAGVDMLTGGAGADVFRLAAGDSLSAAADTIADFLPGTDRIDLSQIDADAATPGRQAFTFIGSDAFSATAGELRYGFNGTETYLKGDLDGDGAADLVILLSGEIVPLVADFIL